MAALLEPLTVAIDSHPILATFLCFAFCFYMYHDANKVDLRHIPAVGFSNPLLSYIDLIMYRINARAFVLRGYEKFKDQAFKIPNVRRWVVFLNGAKYVEELRKVPEDVLSSRAVVNEAMQTEHILGRNFAENYYHLSVIRKQMTRNISEFLADLHDEVQVAFGRFMPLNEEWTAYNPNVTLLRIISESVNRICVGAPHCRNQELIETSLDLTRHLSVSSIILSAFPEFLQPYVVRFIPGLKKSKRKWLDILEPIINERKQMLKENSELETTDVLTWLIEEAGISDSDELRSDRLAFRILMINHGALSTTNLISVHVLYHIASELKYMAPLRQDIEEAIAEEGWTKNALDKMYKLDAFIKETMRMHPISIGLVGHKALKNYTFSDGTVIPKDTVLVVPADAIHYDELNYTDAHEFKGFRFLETETSDKDKGKYKDNAEVETTTQSSFVKLTPQYLPFGHGNHACPGRFFAASTMKLVLAYLLMNYDFKLEKETGERPKDFFFGTIRMPNQEAKLLMRKRQNAA